MHSSVDAYKAQVEARNKAQKAALTFQGPDAGERLAERLEAAERKIKVLEDRIERVEALNDVTG